MSGYVISIITAKNVWKNPYGYILNILSDK